MCVHIPTKLMKEFSEALQKALGIIDSIFVYLLYFKISLLWDDIQPLFPLFPDLQPARFFIGN